MTSKTDSEKLLLKIAERCKQAANGLEEEVKFLSTRAKGDLASTLRVAVKVKWRKSRLQISSDMQDLQISVETRTSNEASKVKAHVTAEVGRTSTQLSQVMTAIGTQAATFDQRQRFLKSLKFPGMNERANMVTDSHKDTFHWIFGTQDPSGRPEEQAWDSFSDWLKSESKIFWISGKPGSGKSTLVKFILSDPGTKAALNIWRPGTVVFRHFLWKPGSSMQKSIKGLLCSILHQAFERDENELYRAMTSKESFRSKDADTDWSVTELTSLCVATLENYSTSVCIFVDGLDEVVDPDAVALMQILDTWKSISSVKICLASRPEPRINRRLRIFQRLRLQDLTVNDMRRLAEDTLKSVVSRWDKAPIEEQRLLQRLPALVVDKAEGVFLWVVLAVSSLQRGAENEDTVNQLYHRLESLPSDLSDLYFDMWSRLNDDEPLYRRAAAEYFNLVIMALRVEGTCQAVPAIVVWTALLVLSASTDSEIQHDLWGGSGAFTYSDLNHRSNQLVSTLEIRCAGLLEVVEDRRFDGRSVRFIHRTAYDFVVDTEDGRRIRTADPSTEQERMIRLVKGYLIALRFIKDGQNGIHAIFDALLQLLRLVRQPPPPEARQVLLQVEVNSILKRCMLWYEDGHFVATNKDCPRQCFVSVLAEWPEFNDFIFSNLKKAANPDSIATMILRDFQLSNDYQSTWPIVRNVCDKQKMHILENLFQLGANPNDKGILLNRWSFKIRYPFAYGTASLRYCCTYSELRYPRSKPESPRMIDMFFNTGPGLDCPTYLCNYGNASESEWMDLPRLDSLPAL